MEKIKRLKYFRRENGERVLDEVYPGDIIVLFDDNLALFKDKHRDIFDSSFKILISRNPYDKIISCFNYHPYAKNKSLLSFLKNEEYTKYDSSKIDFKLKVDKKFWSHYSFFSHFYLLQTNALVENNKLLIDKTIRFESLNEEIYDLFKMINLDIGNYQLDHLNKTKEKKYNLLSNVEIQLINKRFYNDFKYLNYRFK